MKASVTILPVSPILVNTTPVVSEYYDCNGADMVSVECYLTDSASTTFTNVVFQLQGSNAVPPSEPQIGNGWDPPAASFMNTDSGTNSKLTATSVGNGLIWEGPARFRFYRVTAVLSGLSGASTLSVQSDLHARGPAA